jgi:hypothetical protein
VVNISDVLAWDAEKTRLFAQAIRGHPAITGFEEDSIARGIPDHPTITGFGEDNDVFPYESLDAVYSALATLPTLKLVKLRSSGRHVQPEDESALAHPESLTELLRVPSLRYVCFDTYDFTSALCQAAASPLTQGTAVTKLEFRNCCFPPAEESTPIMTKALTINTSVARMNVVSPVDGVPVLYGALAAALPSNSTLRHLELVKLDSELPSFWRQGNDDPDSLSPVLLALGKNTGLKTLTLGLIDSMGETLSTAMKDGFGMNETLESLEINQGCIYDYTTDLWCRAFSFLRTNKTLKSLKFDMDHSPVSCLSAFRTYIATMLQENTSLENLSINESRDSRITAEEYFVLVMALQHNTTLKTLTFVYYGMLHLTEDEGKQMVSLLKKNYALESLPGVYRKDLGGDAGAILRLNAAGRRYLIQDGSSVSKGVEVLSRVNNDMNCVLLHLLENPRLCDRSAVEKVSDADDSDGSSTNPTASSGEGKREQASARKGKESRRRLA